MPEPSLPSPPSPPRPKPIFNVHSQLLNFRAQQLQEVKNITDFKTHALPLEHIKRIMKYDEDVDVISSDACVVFSKACEMFIKQLTLRSWFHVEENKKETVQRCHIATAISHPVEYDFLTDTVPRDDIDVHIDTQMGQGP
uniref:Nuclear transcription factor Y subunit C-2 n=2 Tax=Cajanus cajan TaxID=3821 RepID=A0A151QV74_CAJCA|nr:Nuclear transcription factor Y subunit C-2 [Cajanus cajan]